MRILFFHAPTLYLEYLMDEKSTLF